MQASKRGLHFSLFETALLVGFAVLATAVLVRPASYGGPELVDVDLPAELERRYGPERFSMGIEEWIIRDFFADQHGGVFVDVGAWDPVKGSNTYRLERDLGWSGLAVDAIEEFRPRYAAARPSTTFVAAFVAETDGGTRELHVPEGLTAVASGDSSFVRRFTDREVARQVSSRTLDSLLAEAGITAIDLLSMDIELGEPAALKGFSIERHRPRLVCIEAHGQTRQRILDYFAEHGYVVVGRYLPHDPVNLYFAPRGFEQLPDD